MRQIDYVPEEGSGIIGKVVVELPKYRQRLKYIKDCNFKMGSDGEVSMGIDQMDSVIKMVEIAENHVKDVDLVHEESGVKAKSFDDLEDYQEFDMIINEVANLVLAGQAVGKN